MATCAYCRRWAGFFTREHPLCQEMRIADECDRRQQELTNKQIPGISFEHFHTRGVQEKRKGGWRLINVLFPIGPQPAAVHVQRCTAEGETEQ